MNIHFDPERPFSSDAHLQVPRPRHRAAGKTIRGSAGWLAASTRRLYQSFALWLVRRHMTRELHALDDRALADIGVSRSDITAIVHEAGGYRDRSDNRDDAHHRPALQAGDAAGAAAALDAHDYSASKADYASAMKTMKGLVDKELGPVPAV